MNNHFSCDIIKDLLPGYIDEILSEAGKDLVRKHLDECEACSRVYLEMKEELDTDTEPNEKLVLDGLKKIRRHTRRLKTAIGIIAGMLILFLLSAFIKIFVTGSPLSTSEISADELLYDEETDCLVINGTVNLASCRVTRIVWEENEDDRNAVNVLVYGAETLPFQSSTEEFTVSIPDMKGKKAYFACPDYDREEIYNWEHYHNEKVADLENEIYSRFFELDRNKDALNYIGGIESVNGTEGVCFSVNSVIGENASYWTFNDQLITDGEFESRNFDIWISLDEPYQIFIYDYQTGKYTDDYSIINRH